MGVRGSKWILPRSLNGGETDLGTTSFAERRFAAEDVVVVLGEAVGFVADVLQQPQCIGMPAQPAAAPTRRGR